MILIETQLGQRTNYYSQGLHQNIFHSFYVHGTFVQQHFQGKQVMHLNTCEWKISKKLQFKNSQCFETARKSTGKLFSPLLAEHRPHRVSSDR